MLFLMHVTTVQHFNYTGPEFKNKNAVYVSDIPVTLKQGQGHRTWPKSAELKQGYNHVKLEISCLNSVREKANMKVFVRSGSWPFICLDFTQI